MAKLTVIHTGISEEVVLETSAAISILNTLLRAGVQINHRCGGKAQCGTCRIRVLEGSEHLSPIGDREERRLVSVPADEGVRLACQTYLFGDVTIEIPGRAEGET